MATLTFKIVSDPSGCSLEQRKVIFIKLLNNFVWQEVFSSPLVGGF
jgi:hypothetical protein